MKFHANPKLLVATGALCISGLFALTAQASVNSAQLQELNQDRSLEHGAGFSDNKRQKNLLELLGKPNTNSSKALVCGDSEPDAGEECDDGNLANGDGCDATCTTEAGWECTTAIAGQLTQNILPDGSFEDGNVGGSWTSINHSLFGPNLICGDSCFGTPFAAAPDGSLTSGNYVLVAGGSFDNNSTGNATHGSVAVPANASTLEFQWATLASGAAGDPCAGPSDGMALSINGTQVWSNLDGPVTCTNVNPYTRVVIDLATAAGGPYQGTNITFDFTASATGVPPNVDLTNIMLDDVSISIPAVPVIPPVPSACFQAVCGDGIFSAGEECDDGNVAGGDGCSAGCTIEQPDFVCEDPTIDSFDILAGAADNAVTEGSLEDGRGRFTFAWDESAADAGVDPDFTPICSEVFCGAALANEGAFYAWFGGQGDATDTAISQTVTIPATATDLTFELLVGICDGPTDYLEVNIDGNQVYEYLCTADTATYQTQTVDISAFADGLDHVVEFHGETFSANAGNTNFFVDSINISTNITSTGAPGACFALDTACDTIETFDAGIPAGWTVVNLGQDAADGWGASNDGICASQNWTSGVAGNNVTTGAGLAACADSDATGQIDLDGGAPAALEMDTYLCSPALDLSLVSGPRFSFNANFQSADVDFNDNGTADPLDDFDDDLLEVLVGTVPPSAFSLNPDTTTYVRLGGVNDHLDSNLNLTGPQELSANLEGTALEGAAVGHVCLRYRATYAWFAQIDNAGLRGEDCALAPLDSDGDGVFDSTDNCTLVANPDQLDSNGDGIGNICDQDINNNCNVDFVDYGFMISTAVLFSTPGDPGWNPDYDFTGDGVFNFLDIGRFGVPGTIFAPPGPSANDCVVGLGN